MIAKLQTGAQEETSEVFSRNQENKNSYGERSMEHKDDGKAGSTFERDPLHHFAKRLSATKTLRDGHIILRMTGESGGNYCLRCEGSHATLSQEIPPGNHHVELIGDAKQLRPILEGRKDARVHFLAGGFRVKGNISYISDLAMELGILKQPI
jgi:hypothetical protein